MRNQEKCARHRQVSERTCIKQNQFIKDAAIALAAVVFGYMFITFGLGHLFGVI